MQEARYIAIDLKSFYASAECIDRGLDPMTTHLVVADASRTEKTICLAVSPALKRYGIPGRPRLFEVVRQVGIVNATRRKEAPKHAFTGKSCFENELAENPALALDYLVAPPRMARYMELSTQIYRIYTQFIAPEDIHVYSIDEVFLDVSKYSRAYGLSARALASKIIRAVYEATGITATAGIGTNLYLCKVALDIVAKHVPADENGVRIAELDEAGYRKQLWAFRPLTAFWRVGKGYAEKLERNGMFTMGDIARCSLNNEDLLYRLFGVNAELLIDHAWGWEPCTIADIKAYRPKANSLGAGQVLSCAYSFEKAKLVVKEMTESLAFELVERDLVTDQVVLTVGYDVENLAAGAEYEGEITQDRYGRKMPKHAHGTTHLDGYTSSIKKISEAVAELFEKIVDRNLTVRRAYLSAERVVPRNSIPALPVQLDIFACVDSEKSAEEERERRIQETVLSVRKKFGKNALVKGMNLEEGATAIERNGQIGGHKK